MPRKVTKITAMKLNEVSLVGDGANQHARVGLWKNKDGQPGKACGDCRHDADCMAEGKCLLSGHEIVKDGDAKNFNEALDDQQVYERMNAVYQMTSALNESIRSILQDDGVADKAAMIADSLEQFASAAKTKLQGIVKAKDDAAAGGNVAGVSGQGNGQGDKTMTKANEGTSPDNKGDAIDVQKMVDEAVAKAVAATAKEKDEQIKKLSEDLQKMKTEDLAKSAVEKARGFAGVPGVKVEDLAKAILETPASAMTVFEGILKAADAVIKSGKAFSEFGGNGQPPEGDTKESGIVKAAKARAAELTKSAA